jgi:hypothetical protein
MIKKVKLNLQHNFLWEFGCNTREQSSYKVTWLCMLPPFSSVSQSSVSSTLSSMTRYLWSNSLFQCHLSHPIKPFFPFRNLCNIELKGWVLRVTVITNTDLTCLWERLPDRLTTTLPFLTTTKCVSDAVKNLQVKTYQCCGFGVMMLYCLPSSQTVNRSGFFLVCMKLWFPKGLHAISAS